MSTDLAIHAIRIDGGTQSRAGLNTDTLAEYVEALGRGDVFPPVVVYHDGKNYWLVDGFHRVEAFQTLGRKKIAVEIKQGTQEDAQWFSCGANASHGLKRTNADKRRAVEMALKCPKSAGLSAREIAAHCGVDHKTVAPLMRALESTGEIPQLEARKGKDGHSRPARRLTRSESTTHPDADVSPDDAAPAPSAAPALVEIKPPETKPQEATRVAHKPPPLSKEELEAFLTVRTNFLSRAYSTYERLDETEQRRTLHLLRVFVSKNEMEKKNERNLAARAG